MGNKLEFDDLDVFLKNKQLSAVIRTLESDRKRIAQDLHDDISSKLNVISLNCYLLKIPNLPQKDIEEITKNIIEYTSKALNSSKKMTHSLLPPVLDKFGLHAGIEELCAQLFDDGAVEIRYENNLEFDFKDNDKHIHVFRILQELFANSIKHGKATMISVLFDTIDGKRTCKYSDNGIGFDVNQLENHKGLGMKNVVSRVAVLEGSLSIESQMNNGITVIFNF
ncbi:ATP-binding protein [Flavobacterium granuli]|uniref:histidine kinase n=1 Tax=Flavobacterium granuli TaxID=280093 RepID=A0ABU1S664_9FLAO|nr:ATP-binding protein [Flavobacterium granuli]MDR6846483.1 signal transduction histidine kinase [Flavobacterium granuli]